MLSLREQEAGKALWSPEIFISQFAKISECELTHRRGGLTLRWKVPQEEQGRVGESSTHFWPLSSFALDSVYRGKSIWLGLMWV